MAYHLAGWLLADEDDEMMRSGMQAQEVPLRRGDNVVVIKGDLLNLQGRVEAVNEGKGTFILKTFDKEIIAHGIDTFEMPVDEVMKFFHVCIGTFRTSPLVPRAHVHVLRTSRRLATM